jgi:hypothetical protein
MDGAPRHIFIKSFALQAKIVNMVEQIEAPLQQMSLAQVDQESQ